MEQIDSNKETTILYMINVNATHHQTRLLLNAGSK